MNDFQKSNDAMSRLNTSIKLLLIIGNFFLLTLSCIATIGAGLVLWGKAFALDSRAIKELSVVVILLASTTIFCTILGCSGVINQTSKKGKKVEFLFAFFVDVAN